MLDMYVDNRLSIKRFHRASARNIHEYSLKSSIGKARERSTLRNKRPNASGKHLAGSNVNIAPERSEIKVSLFDPGYGESVLLHLGENTWIVVDSCIDPITGDPASLTYLHQVHIDPTTSVRQVIATHWHDDHIRGLGRVMESCVSAEFVCSAALRQKEFLTRVAAYGRFSVMESPALQEFNKILQVLEARGQERPGQQPRPPTFATASRCIWRNDVRTSRLSYPCSIYALSPSDASLVLAHRHIAALLPQPKTTKLRIPALTPNHAAVVLWVNIGEVFILLGSDLEETGNPNTGWSIILGSKTYPQARLRYSRFPIMALLLRIIDKYGRTCWTQNLWLF
jgi:hypothetical protein